MRSSKATSRFLPALVLALIAVLPAYVGSLWTGVAKLAFAEEAPPRPIIRSRRRPATMRPPPLLSPGRSRRFRRPSPQSLMPLLPTTLPPLKQTLPIRMPMPKGISIRSP
jgi:hypothetical protein